MDDIELLKTLPRKKPTPAQIEEARIKIVAEYNLRILNAQKEIKPR